MYTEKIDALAFEVIELARQKGITLGCAESCTGGLLAGAITDVSGASLAFNGGVVSYANEVKQGILGVKSETLVDEGAVSETCALEMAHGARDALKADVAVSTTGIAGPTGGSDEKPVGTVCFGIYAKNKGSVWSKTFTEHFHGDRDEVRLQAVAFALNLYREFLLNV